MLETKLVDVDEIGSLEPILCRFGRIGLDTEFMREKTFYPQLCLVQIATVDRIYCVDPLGADSSLDRLDGFWRTLMDCDWVVHAGRQDIEVLHHTAARMPRQIFDTQIAASLLGFPPQIGYANLVSELFDVSLPKSHTRADWSRRPLPAALVRYAAEDVEYLLPAYERLVTELERKGRLGWALQDSADLIEPALYDNDPGNAIRRLKGARNLSGASRAAAERLAAWREREAVQRNRPRQWIMKDAVLLEIAARLPETRKALAATPGLSERTAARATDNLLGLIAQARERSSSYEPPRRPDERQKAVLKKLQASTAACASELGVAAETIAPKKELSEALAGRRDTRVFRGWRRGVIGERLLEMLDGG